MSTDQFARPALWMTVVFLAVSAATPAQRAAGGAIETQRRAGVKQERDLSQLRLRFEPHETTLADGQRMAFIFPRSCRLTSSADHLRWSFHSTKPSQALKDTTGFLWVFKGNWKTHQLSALRSTIPILLARSARRRRLEVTPGRRPAELVLKNPSSQQLLRITLAVRVDETTGWVMVAGSSAGDAETMVRAVTLRRRQ